MQQIAAVRSVKQAMRMLKHMNVQAPEWGEYQAASREAVRQVLEDRMHGLLGNRIAELAANGVQDRRNGAYRRWLLTGLGAIELWVPRTRTMSGVAILQRYARRATRRLVQRWHLRYPAAVRCLVQDLDAEYQRDSSSKRPTFSDVLVPLTARKPAATPKGGRQERTSALT